MADIMQRLGNVETNSSSTYNTSKAGLAAWDAIKPLVSIASGTVEEGNLVYSQTLE